MQGFEPAQSIRLPLFILLMLTLFLTAPLEMVRAASITVDENCSLGDAIEAANQDAAVGGCAAGDGADTIALTGDITLTEALPTMTGAIVIEGNNHTISGDDRYNIFAAAESSLVIRNVTLAQGFSGDFGGGLYARDSRVEMIDSEIRNNSAGAGGGGGIYFSSSSGAHSLDIVGVSFIGNSSAGGGGALKINGGAVTIRRSGFSFNIGDQGGAIENANAALQIENSTFSGNEARLGGGLSSFGAEVTLTHTTWAYNSASERGGAVHLEGWNGTIRLRNTLMAGSRSGGDCSSGLNPDSITENAASLIQDGSCSPALAGDPLLDEVTGSPAYFPLRPGSAAIGRGDARYCLAGDQSGTSRAPGDACEIGAYEVPAELLEVLAEATVTSTPTATLTPTSDTTLTLTSDATLTPTSEATVTPTSEATLTSTPETTPTSDATVTLTPEGTLTPTPQGTLTPTPEATPAPAAPPTGGTIDTSRLGFMAVAFALVGAVMVFRLRNETGQSLVEYTLILIVVAVVIIVILALISPSIDSILANIIQQLNTP